MVHNKSGPRRGPRRIYIYIYIYIWRNPDFAGFSRFSNVPGRFEFLLNSFDETPSSFHTASTRSIHPRPPFPPISISLFFINPPSHIFGTNSSPNFVERPIPYCLDLDIYCLSNLWDPSRVVRIDLLYRMVDTIF